MDKSERARHIIDHVLAMDEKWGKPNPRAEGSARPSRIISDECRWHATLSRENHKGPDGELWDFIEVHAYGQLRMMAAFRGDQVDVRSFDPGGWEPLFGLIDPSDRTPLRLNHGTDWEM